MREFAVGKVKGRAGTREPEQVERDNKAVELRRRHLTYDQIAKEMGYASKSSAYAAVRRGLADSVMESNDEVRQQEVDRLDELARRALRVIMTPHYKVSGREIVRDPKSREPLIDDQPVLNAINSLLKIMERRAELLGLNAVRRVEVLTIGMVDQEIARLTAELAGRLEPSEHEG
jgi:predicted transcriptional regulator